MSKSFMVYWRQDQIRAAIASRILDHAASEQFGPVRPGDVLWITGRGLHDPLVTVGPLPVAKIVRQDEAERRLGSPLWRATYHALSAPSAATKTREIALTPILKELEFESPRSPRLDLGKPLGYQLQRMRRLTEASAEKMGRLWSTRQSG